MKSVTIIALLALNFSGIMVSPTDTKPILAMIQDLEIKDAELIEQLANFRNGSYSDTLAEFESQTFDDYSKFLDRLFVHMAVLSKAHRGELKSDLKELLASAETLEKKLNSLNAEKPVVKLFQDFYIDVVSRWKDIFSYLLKVADRKEKPKSTKLTKEQFLSYLKEGMKKSVDAINEKAKGMNKDEELEVLKEVLDMTSEALNASKDIKPVSDLANPFLKVIEAFLAKRIADAEFKSVALAVSEGVSEIPEGLPAGISEGLPDEVPEKEVEDLPGKKCYWYILAPLFC